MWCLQFCFVVSSAVCPFGDWSAYSFIVTGAIFRRVVLTEVFCPFVEVQNIPRCCRRSRLGLLGYLPLRFDSPQLLNHQPPATKEDFYKRLPLTFSFIVMFSGNKPFRQFSFHVVRSWGGSEGVIPESSSAQLTSAARSLSLSAVEKGSPGPPVIIIFSWAPDEGPCCRWSVNNFSSPSSWNP